MKILKSKINTCKGNEKNIGENSLMKKKYLDIVGMVIIGSVVAVFSLIIGANEKGLRTLPMAILLFITLIYLIVRKILLKQKIVVKNKVDLIVLLFMCSTMLPLLFKTYCTLQGTVEFILKYFFVYAMYLLVRNTIDSANKLEILASITIVSSLIVIVLGIDLQHEQFFHEIIKKLNLNYTKDTRFSSTFGYANSVAIYIMFCIFLSIYKVQNAKNKIVKGINIIYILLGTYIVYITISRAVFILLLLGIILYFVLYYHTVIFKSKKRLIILIGAILTTILALIIMIKIGLKYSTQVSINDEYENALRYSFEANKEYEIKLDINTINVEGKNKKAETKQIKDAKSEIKIIEEDIYRNEKILATKEIEGFNGIKTFKIMPKDNLLRIIIKISTNNNEEIIINKCYINNEEYILSYKYIPSQIYRLLTSFSSKEGSINQRLIFYKDCLKIAENNWLVGQGGNTWKKLSFAVQEQSYNIKETHSYFFELLISYGIIGVVLFLAIFFEFNIVLIREYRSSNKGNRANKEKLAILLGLDLLILHSVCFDFNMSFLLINLLVFMYIAALTYNLKECKLKIEDFSLLEYIIFMCLATITIILTCASIAKYCVKDKNIKKCLALYNCTYAYDCISTNMNRLKKEKVIGEIQEIMKNEPYYNQNEVYNEYWNLILNIDNIDSEQLLKYLKFINTQYKKIKMATPMQVDTIIIRANTMANAYIRLKEMNYTDKQITDEIEELKLIIQNEYKKNIIIMKDKERNGLEQEKIDQMMLEYKDILGRLEE